MPTELDQKIERVVGMLSGPGGLFQIEKDERGRSYVANLPGTLPLFFDTFCMIHGEAEALVAEDERFTFAQLNARANALAQALASGWGIGKGDRVAIAMRNCPSWILCYMAVLKAGGIATLLNGWWQADEMAHALRLSEPKLVIADESRGQRIAACGYRAPLVSLKVEAPAPQALAPLLERAGAEVDLPTVTPEDPATILFTSGSTGSAKGALSTHRAVTTGAYNFAMTLAVLKAILEGEGRPPNPPRTLVVVPLFHVTGEVPVLLNSFVINRAMVLMRKWDAGEALKLMEKERITYFVGVPTMSLELMQHPDRDRYDLSFLTDLAAGGAARPPEHVRRLKDSFQNANPAIGYGLTETNAIGVGNVWSNYLEKPSSTGRVYGPFVELAILDDGGVPVPSGERGEIAIRSAANIEGYWRDPAATAAAFTADGWFRTGDIGTIDADGYLFIVDRKKDIIIRGGENIACIEVEGALYAHEAVAEAAVFGVPDARLGEVPAAVVHLKEGQSADADALRETVAGQLAPFKVPAYLHISDQPLPKLGTGKIDKVTIRTLFRRGMAGA